MTTPADTPTPDVRAIAGSLSPRLRDALDYEERTYLEACELNALGLVHLDVVKDADGTLIDLRTSLTPLGEQVAAHLKETSGE